MQIIENIINLIINAGIFQGIFLVFLLKKSEHRNTKSVFWLSILSIMISVSIIHSYYITPYFSGRFGHTFKIIEPGVLLISPLLWFYIKSIVTTEFRLTYKKLSHFIPYLILCIILFPNVYDLGIKGYFIFFDNYSLIATIILWLVIFIQFAIYFRNMIIISNVHGKKIEEELSNSEGFDIKWIRYFLSIFFCVYVLIMITIMWLMHFGDLTNFPKLISLIFSIAVFFLTYKGLFQKEFSNNTEKHPIINTNELVDSNQIKESEIELIENQEKIEKYRPMIQKLELYFQTEKPYLNPEMTLTLLAEKMGYSRNVLSDLINSGMNDNFYNLINRYRVEQVKEFLNDPKRKNYTILANALDAGFASKATFNSIFKKFTGLTPSNYRNRLS